MVVGYFMVMGYFAFNINLQFDNDNVNIHLV